MRNRFPSSRTTSWPSYRALQTVCCGECPFVRWDSKSLYALRGSHPIKRFTPEV